MLLYNEFAEKFADILSVISMTNDFKDETKDGEEDYFENSSLFFRLEGGTTAVESWGHEYIRNLMMEVIREYSSRKMLKKDDHDIIEVAHSLIPYCMSHHSEAEACDLLGEINQLESILQFTTSDNYKKVCLYLTSCIAYVSMKERKSMSRICMEIFIKFENFCEAMNLAIQSNDPQTFIAHVFKAIPKDDILLK